MQKKIKHLILGLIAIFIIIIMILIVLIPKINKENKNKEINEQITSEREDFEKLQEDPSAIINGKKLEKVQQEGIYLTIDRIIQKFSTYLKEKNSKAIYNVLYEDYINSNNITEATALKELEQYTNYEIKQMLRISTTSYGIYYIKLNVNKNTQFIMVNWDTQNNTFSIAPIDEETYNEGNNQGMEINKQRIESIEKNEYNKVIIQRVDNDGIAEKYFYDYIEKMLHNTQEAYEILDAQYKGKTFSNYDDFSEYINSNKEKLEKLDHNNLKTVKEFDGYEEYEDYYQKAVQMKMENYIQTSKNGIKTYVFQDTYGKYYTFKVTAAMEYTVILDNYSIPTEEFIQEYNNSTDGEKLVLNIKKFFMGIDDKNYGYSYSVLSESFKENKYKTKQDFVNYVKENFFEENELEYVKYEKQNNLYIYEIKVTDATGKSTEQKAFNIIMKLNEGTDFEMSFSEK